MTNTSQDITRVLERATNPGSRYLRIGTDDTDRELVFAMVDAGLLEIQLEHDGVMLIQATPWGIEDLWHQRANRANA
ncbi:MAG: hypothetical protein AAGC53_15145 [Actinomycetota bacterium]